MKEHLLGKAVMPIHVEEKQFQALEEFKSKTGLSKNFIIRRCIDYAMEQFDNHKVDILTLEERD